MKYLCKTRNPRVPIIVDVPHVVTQRVDDSQSQIFETAKNLHKYLEEQCRPVVLIDFIPLFEEPADHTCRMCNGCGLIRVGDTVIEPCTCIKKIGLTLP